MQILLANPRGFCAGVDRAISIVERALEMYGAPIYVRHEVVHNRYVVSSLRERGAIFIEEISEVPDNAILIFSAHGVSQAVRAEAKARSLTMLFDATCPLVTKVHHEARRFATDDTQIVLIGHAGHEEVEGTTGEAPEHITLVQGPEEVADLELDPQRPVSWLSQTTLSVDETAQTLDRLRQLRPDLLDPPSDDICYATSNRQYAITQIGAHCDLVIVVGSANSSNTGRLVDVAVAAGAGAAHRVDDAAEIDDSWLDGVATIGVTSGASVPEQLVQDVLAVLEAKGWPPAVEESLIEESMTFALPPQLRSRRTRPAATGA